MMYDFVRSSVSHCLRACNSAAHTLAAIGLNCNNGSVQRRPLEAPVRSGILSQDSNVKRGRGRPKLTWVEAIKGDLKGWNIPKDLALDRSAWKTDIHVSEL